MFSLARSLALSLSLSRARALSLSCPRCETVGRVKRAIDAKLTAISQTFAALRAFRRHGCANEQGVRRRERLYRRGVRALPVCDRFQGLLWFCVFSRRPSTRLPRTKTDRPTPSPRALPCAQVRNNLLSLTAPPGKTLRRPARVYHKISTGVGSVEYTSDTYVDAPHYGGGRPRTAHAGNVSGARAGRASTAYAAGGRRGLMRGADDGWGAEDMRQRQEIRRSAGSYGGYRSGQAMARPATSGGRFYVARRPQSTDGGGSGGGRRSVSPEDGRGMGKSAGVGVAGVRSAVWQAREEGGDGGAGEGGGEGELDELLEQVRDDREVAICPLAAAIYHIAIYHIPGLQLEELTKSCWSRSMMTVRCSRRVRAPGE